MSDVQEKYNTENTKQTFIEFAEENLIDAQLDVFKYYSKLNNADFIRCINANFDLYAILEYCYRFLLDSPKYNNIPKECLEVLNRKSYDYSSKDNRYSNFEISNKWAENCLNFINDEPVKIGLDNKISFAILLGTKVARLKELLLSNKEPKNEAIEDSIIDFMNYRLLLEGYILGLQ